MIIYRWNQWAKPIKIGRSFNFYNDLASLALVRFTATTHKQKHSSIHSSWMYLSIHTQKKTRKRKRRPKRISNQSEFYNETSEYIQNVRLSESYGSFKHDRLHNRVFFSSSKLLCCFFLCALCFIRSSVR